MPHQGRYNGLKTKEVQTNDGNYKYGDQKSIGVIELSEPDIKTLPRTVFLYVDENTDLEKLGISVS